MKKVIPIVITVLVVFLTFLIYKGFDDKKIYYLALGDSLAAGRVSYGNYGAGYSDYINEYLEVNDKLDKFVKDFAVSGYKVDDLINDINNNKEITLNNKKIYLKNALVKANLITLSIGSNDVIRAFKSNSDLDEAITNTLGKVNELLEILRVYNKDTIVVTSYYNPYYFNIKWNSKIANANTKLKQLCKKYDIIYVDIYSLFQNSEYLPNALDPHPSSLGYKKISDLIINELGDEL